MHEVKVGTGDIEVVAKRDEEGENSGFILFTTMICKSGTPIFHSAKSIF